MDYTTACEGESISVSQILIHLRMPWCNPFAKLFIYFIAIIYEDERKSVLDKFSGKMQISRRVK